MYIKFLFAGISSVIAQIPSANPFRWIGYFNAFTGGFLLVLLFSLFDGEYSANLSNLKKGVKLLWSCQKLKTEDLQITRVVVS